MHILNGMIGGLIGLFWGLVLFHMDYAATNPWALLLTILITTFSRAGLGLLMGWIGLITRNVMFVNNTVYFVLLVFSGANLDLPSLPTWMQVVSNYLPLTRGIASARLIITGHGLAEVMPLLVEEFGIGLFFAFLGYTLFRWFEITAKKRGTLEVF
jgi:ABC-2 type transport system permease protein